MYCKKCGVKNDDDAKFCTECGASLGESKEAAEVNEKISDEKVHDSIFRKALKRDAKEKPKGALCGMVVAQIALSIILFLIMFVSIAVAAYNGDVNAGSVFAFVGLIFFVIIAYFVFTMLISVGMMKAGLAISRGETVTFGSAFKSIFQNFGQILKAIGGILLYSIGFGILSLIPFVGGIASLILQIYFLPVLVTFIFMTLDYKYKDISMTDMFHKSMNLVNGHRVEYYGLMFSFIGWMLLASVTLGLLYIWLIPYMIISMSNWYLALNGETNYIEGESGMSNVAIIVVTGVGYLAFVFILIFTAVMLFIANGIDSVEFGDKFNKFTNDLIEDNYDYSDIKNENNSSANGKVINMSGINVYIPSDYKETTMDSYDKIYKSPYGDIYVGTNSQIFSASREDFVQTLLAQYATMGFKCGTDEVRNINDNEWVNFECDYNSNTNIYLYITQKNNKLYYLIITDAGDVSDGKKLLGNIEKNLGLAY